jgi:hypothetical protein
MSGPGYSWDVRFSTDIPGTSLTYPIFVILKRRYPGLIFVASKTNIVG